MKLYHKLFSVIAILTAIFIVGCQDEIGSADVVEINRLMNDWHKAAAEADEEIFFGFMAKDCIYMGTDPSEKWHRDELKMWSEKYFQSESAWDFKPHDREIYSEKGVIWFDEQLDTWMGNCRGSGVIVKTTQGWKLKHYNLAVTVPNEKMKGFIDLISSREDTTAN